MKNFCFFLFLTLLPFQIIIAQTAQVSPTPGQKQLILGLEKDFSVQREVVYLHLNKSLLLKGEQLGFAAYVVNKQDLRPSLSTTNLYVQVKNAAGEIVKEELLLVENGVATSVINIDSNFSSGNYTILAFTNWMRNFHEQNFFAETIRVVESNLEISKANSETPKIDAQFLPESGHLLSGILNNIGVIVRDSLGHGLSNAEVTIKDSRDRVVANTELNQWGIGRFSFIPDLQENYEAVIVYQGREYPVMFSTKIEEQGIVISGSQRGRHLNLLIKTNSGTLPDIQSKTYLLRIQGRKVAGTYLVNFTGKQTVALTVDFANLDPGVNVVTLFDEEGQPVTERLFFNFTGIPVEKTKELDIVEQNDSLQLNLSFEDKQERWISVSVLPQNSIAETRHHNILSYNFLQPFVRGPIENAGWYFENITEDKMNQLDNLLLTQGWSSYDWQSMFKSDTAFEHKFESHFSLNFHVSKKDQKRNGLKYMLHASNRNPLQVFEVPTGTAEFFFDGYLPVNGEKLNISRVQRNDLLLPAEVSVQFFPNFIPTFQPQMAVVAQKPSKGDGGLNSLAPAFFDFDQNAEQLEEVLLTATVDKVKERERKLNHHSYGRVSVIKDQDIRAFPTLGDYLRSKNIRVTEAAGTFSATSSFGGGGENFLTGSANDEQTAEATGNSPQAPEDPLNGMAIYLDDNYIPDTSMFYGYSLANVDYIEINKTGMGSGFIGARGSIKIYTNFGGKRGDPRQRQRMQQLDIPLAYSENKTFYTPRYQNQHDSFFEQYGIIAWKPDVALKNSISTTLEIQKPQVDFQIIIEGFTADGNLIYDVKTVSLDE